MGPGHKIQFADRLLVQRRNSLFDRRPGKDAHREPSQVSVGIQIRHAGLVEIFVFRVEVRHAIFLGGNVDRRLFQFENL